MRVFQSIKGNESTVEPIFTFLFKVTNIDDRFSLSVFCGLIDLDSIKKKTQIISIQE